MGWWEAIPAVAQAAGSIYGSVKQGEYSDKALGVQQDAYQRALDLINQGNLSFTPERAGELGPSAMGGVQSDARSRMAQEEALGELGLASREGYNEIDKAAINAMLSEVGQQERGNREAALARLDPGSGASVAARLGAQQAGANRANQQALSVAAMSRQRALDALGQYGNLASRMRGQSFDEGSKRAMGQDAISRFNAETSRFNAGQANAAAQSGIGNRVGAAGVLRGATQDLAGGLNQRGQMAFNQASGVGGMFGQGAAAFGASQEEKEKPRERDDELDY